MYASIQTVCGCHGYLLFESISCDRCRSMIPFQLTDESLVDPASTNGANNKTTHAGKHAAHMLVLHRKEQQEHRVTTGRVRFRTLCPFCNSAAYVLRYYCKRERVYYHLRIQNFGENEQSIYKSIADIQKMNTIDQYETKRNQVDSTTTESVDDSYSLSGSISQQASTIVYDQTGLPNARDIQIENERKLYQLNDVEGDLFHILRNGLFYDTIIQCQDEVKIQVHRCILGGRSPWFRHLLSEYHNANTQDDYVLQISVDDVQSNVMNEILNFMYTNRCLISLKNAPELLIAAKRFELENLRKQIAEFLLSRLNVDNAIELLISAHEAGSEALKFACIRLINRHADRIKRTEQWKTFKTQYVDLVPELYENRIERPAHGSQTFLPDVFSAPAIPSNSLLTLSQLYENPVQQRLITPTPRTLPAPVSKSQQPLPTHSNIPHNQPIKEGASSTFPQREDPRLSPVMDRKSPVNKRVSSNTRRRTGPPPAAPPLTRTVFPTIKQPSEIDAYRRPVNVYEQSTTLPMNNQHQRPGNTQVIHKQPPPVVTTKATRTVSPKHVMELRRSPTLTESPQEEHLTLARVVSAETIY